MREAGEPQVTFNYFRAFSDYIATFAFGRGINFRSPLETEAIVPSRLERIWEVDNDKHSVLWEIAQQGGVSGDAFVKVAYEEPWTNEATGQLMPGRVRILPLNSAHCFPEWHPHDRSRFLRFKLKYRFWGTSPEGARQVYTYTEILTNEAIEEYINDELISQRPNPLGMIPVVHISNMLVSGSPWGLADCHDIVSLNRTYNEIATDAVDILNYHAAPVTIVTGAKAANLEKGPKKVWSIPTQGAKVENLELGGGVEGLLQYMETLKRGMHELTGVPETALGQVQPISNTSGVALAIQFQPLMQKWHAKVNQYSVGLQKVNDLALRTLFLKQPELLAWNPSTDPPLKDGQLDVLDPADPITYRTVIQFPPPLPIDRLITLNEIQLLVGMSLESRIGALRMLGEEAPELKLEEIRQELHEDALSDGALQLLKTQIQAEIMNLTGMMPGADGASLPPMQDGVEGPEGGVVQPPAPQMPSPGVDVAQLIEAGEAEQIRNEIVTRAYGTKLPQRRNPRRGEDGEDKDD